MCKVVPILLEIVQVAVLPICTGALRVRVPVVQMVDGTVMDGRLDDETVAAPSFAVAAVIVLVMVFDVV